MNLNPYLKSIRQHMGMIRLFAIRGAMAILCAFAAMHAQGRTIIQNFEGFADSAALNAAITYPTANTTITLGTNDGVNGSKALIFQGNNGASPWYSSFTLPVTSFSLAGVQSVTVATKFISGSTENLIIQLIDSYGNIIDQGPAILTGSIPRTSFTDYTITITNRSSLIAGIRIAYGAVNYGTTIVAFDNISVLMLATNTIQDFEGFADSAALNAAIIYPVNSTVTLGITNGVNGSKALIFQGTNAIDPWYSVIHLPVSTFSLTNVQSVTVAVEFISGSGENLVIQLLDSYYGIIDTGPAISTHSISNASFMTYTIPITNSSASIASIRFAYQAVDYGITMCAFDNISLLTNQPDLVTYGNETTLAAVFGNNMVLQEGKAVPVWGVDVPGQAITVTFGGQTKTTTTGLDGKWLVRLDSMAVNATPQNLTVTGSAQRVLTNVVVGEVWLASGQSNMWFPMVPPSPYPTIYTNEIAAANYPLIRHMAVVPSTSSNTVSDVQLWWAWQSCTSNNVANLSAVAYFFGKQLWTNLNVPIGIIESAYGGSSAEAWTSLSALNAIPELKTMADQELATYNQGGSLAYDTPGMCYNAMVQPLIPYAMRGVIWYQGEANAGSTAQANQYRVLFPTLIADWRSRWQQGNLSFYFVQLANYQWPTYTDNWPYTREAQALTLKTATNTGMAVAIDIGDYVGDYYGDNNVTNTIHPRNKKDVGQRLALWALANDYGSNVVCSGPLFKQTYAVETNRIRLFFNYAETGLMVGQKIGANPVTEVVGGTLNWFEIAGTNLQYFPASAQIDGQTVLVSSPSVSNPVTARYAWAGCPTNCNLYNRAGLPAAPFRIWVNTNPPTGLRLSLSNSLANLAITVPSGLTCWLESADTLTAPVWTPLTLPQTATGSALNLQDALSVSGRMQRFYRMSQVPP